MEKKSENLMYPTARKSNLYQQTGYIRFRDITMSLIFSEINTKTKWLTMILTLDVALLYSEKCDYQFLNFIF